VSVVLPLLDGVGDAVGVGVGEMGPATQSGVCFRHTGGVDELPQVANCIRDTFDGGAGDTACVCVRLHVATGVGDTHGVSVGVGVGLLCWKHRWHGCCKLRRRWHRGVRVVNTVGVRVGLVVEDHHSWRWCGRHRWYASQTNSSCRRHSWSGCWTLIIDGICNTVAAGVGEAVRVGVAVNL